VRDDPEQQFPAGPADGVPEGEEALQLLVGHVLLLVGQHHRQLLQNQFDDVLHRQLVVLRDVLGAELDVELVDGHQQQVAQEVAHGLPGQAVGAVHQDVQDARQVRQHDAREDFGAPLRHQRYYLHHVHRELRYALTSTQCTALSSLFANTSSRKVKFSCSKLHRVSCDSAGKTAS
jgi:hypothetical protein